MAVLPGLAAASCPRGWRQVFLPLDVLYVPSHGFFRRQGQAEVRDATCGARLGRRGGRYRFRVVSQAEGFGVMMVGEHGNGLHQHADPNQQYRFNPWPHRLAFLLNPMAKVVQKSLPHNYLPRNLVAIAANGAGRRCPRGGETPSAPSGFAPCEAGLFLPSAWRAKGSLRPPHGEQKGRYDPAAWKTKGSLRPNNQNVTKCL